MNISKEFMLFVGGMLILDIGYYLLGMCIGEGWEISRLRVMKFEFGFDV